MTFGGKHHRDLPNTNPMRQRFHEAEKAGESYISPLLSAMISTVRYFAPIFVYFLQPAPQGQR